MTKIKPVEPSEIHLKKKEIFPDEVIDAFNQLIIKNFDGNSAFIKQEDAIKLIQSKMEITRENLFKNKWLDVEEIYRYYGWNVVYDKPGYNETYEPSFTFTKKQREFVNGSLGFD